MDNKVVVPGFFYWLWLCTMQGFTTDNDHALEQLFGEHSEGTRDYDACIDIIAARLSTVFASLKVLSSINFQLYVNLLFIF